MASPVKLDKYKILISPDSKKTQGLQTGDIVRRQYFDGTNVIYSLMCVLSYGTEKRSVQEVTYNAQGEPVFDGQGQIVTKEVEKDAPYFIGALLEGDAPQKDELLDFARITNLFKVDRSGALYLTSSDDDAPFMDLIDGIGHNKSLCWPENIASEAFEDPQSQYIVHGEGLEQTYKSFENDNNRIVRLTRTAATNQFSGLSQNFYELVEVGRRVLVSYKARASRSLSVNAELGYTTGSNKDAEWTENIGEDWQYYLQAVNVQNSGRHLRTFRLDLKKTSVGDWVEIADFNIILLSSVSNFGEATAMRLGKLDGVTDPVFGTLSGYGAYIQKLYASQTAHVSGTLTAGDENGFGSTFYAGRIHRNCFVNSCSVNFITDIAVNIKSPINPTGIGQVFGMEGEIPRTMVAQTKEWAAAHMGKRYCLSFWGYFKKPCQLNVKQNGMSIGTLQIASYQTHEWRRLHLFFDILELPQEDSGLFFTLTPGFYDFVYDRVGNSIDPDEAVFYFAAPQLEGGETCTAYQPTDGVLDETDDYGAWFARGGIGGTIQNPLLRLNFDGTGAIDTRTNSFRLNLDGSGHLANRNIAWDEDGKVTFGSDVTLNWDNLGNEAQDEMANRYMRIVGSDTFTAVGQEDVQNGMSYSPASITLSLEEVGFTSTSSQRQWYVKRSTGFEPVENANAPTFVVSPDADIWDGESTLTLKCVVTLNASRIYADTFTVKKQFVQGYTVTVTSSRGTAFKNGQCATILTAQVYYQGQPVDVEYARTHFTFNWKRYSVTDTRTPLDFTDYEEVDNPESIQLNYPLDGTEIFVCEIGTADQFDYTFPVIF